MAHKTNRPVALRLFMVFRKGLSIWTTIVWTWKYGLSLRDTMINVNANFSMGGTLSYERRGGHD